MKVQVTIQQINSEYNQEYANEYNFGKESNDNMKTHWGETLEVVGNVAQMIFKESETVPFLRKDLNTNEEIPFEVQDLHVLECVTDKGENSTFVISNKLIAKTHKAQNKKYKTTRIYFYLKDNVEFLRMSHKVYIAKTDLPKEVSENVA